MKRININDIARLAHVSRGTVDRALHGRGDISEKTRKLIVQIASERRYKPHLAARMLVMGRAPLSIGVCIPREIRFFFDQVRDGILQEACHFESVGINTIYRPFERYGKGELDRIEEMLKRDIKALIMAPGFDRSLGALIDEAEKRNIRVVCVAGDVAGCQRSTAVCSDPELNGRCAAELMGKFIRSAARVVIFTGMLQHEIHYREVRSFSEAFEQFSHGGRVIEVIENHESEEEALEKCTSLLKRERHIDGMYISTVNCLPVCAALDAAGLAERVKLVTTDLFPDMVPWFERGTILASVYQRPYMQGQTAVRLIVDHLVSGLPFPPACYLNPLVALRSNLCMFREVSHEKDTEGAIPHLQSSWLQAQ
ncbi:MAG: substrate-binding domain-containing protein [Terriglobia bacterium]|jgi:LacI family transcriptional regulator